MDPIEFRILNDTQVDPEIPPSHFHRGISSNASGLGRNASVGANVTLRPARSAKGDGWWAWVWPRHTEIIP